MTVTWCETTWFPLILLRRHSGNILCQSRSLVLPGWCHIIWGENAVCQLCLMKSYLCRWFCFSPCLPWQNACSLCQTRVPGLPGQKGEKGSPGVQGVEGLVGEKVHPVLDIFNLFCICNSAFGAWCSHI